MMALIGAIIIGFFAGLIARALHPGDDKLGFFLTAGLGIVGSLIATYGGQFLGFYKNGASAGFVASVIGAVVVLVIYNFVAKRT